MSETATAARHSMDSPEWYTPFPFIRAARAVMGGIDLDPASCEEANQCVGATRYYSEQDNGLTQPWHGRVFLNPPGGLVPQFWRKAIDEIVAERVEQLIVIGYSLEQLQTLQGAGRAVSPSDFPLCIPRKRIAFVENAAKRVERIQKLISRGEASGASERAKKVAAMCRMGKPPKDSPSHANFVMYAGPHVRLFQEVFSEFGVVKL